MCTHRAKTFAILSSSSLFISFFLHCFSLFLFTFTFRFFLFVFLLLFFLPFFHFFFSLSFLFFIVLFLYFLLLFFLLLFSFFSFCFLYFFSYFLFCFLCFFFFFFFGPRQNWGLTTTISCFFLSMKSKHIRENITMKKDIHCLSINCENHWFHNPNWLVPIIIHFHSFDLLHD